nr:pyridoxal 5'-phosphate synthase glutaminase subunit PdxT [Brevibacterium album]
MGEAPAEAAPAAAAGLRLGVLALQGAVTEHVDLLRGLGADVIQVRRPEQLPGLAGLVVPGGESTAIGRLAAPLGLLATVRARIAEGMAVLGTCAGLILLSEALEAESPDRFAGLERIGGLDVTVRRNGYGPQTASFEAELETGLGDGSSLRAAFIRAPLIVEVGRRAEVVARLGDRPVAVRQGRVLAATFHPEITGEDRLHREFVRLAAEAAHELPGMALR